MRHENFANAGSLLLSRHITPDDTSVLLMDALTHIAASPKPHFNEANIRDRRQLYRERLPYLQIFKDALPAMRAYLDRQEAASWDEKVFVEGILMLAEDAPAVMRPLLRKAMRVFGAHFPDRHGYADYCEDGPIHSGETRGPRGVLALFAPT